VVITNNQDSQQVLLTVALTVFKFFENHPNASVYVTGSTKSRTRLYQIGISNNLSELIKHVELVGFASNKWEVFRKGVRYEAFLIKRKKVI
jgi:hypothetical protein